MAQLILVPLFNSIGASLIGGAIGSAIGGAVGSVAASYINGLFTPPTRTEGPRLKTQEITSSTEGAPKNMLWGRSRMSGNIIWATRFEEEVTERATGGKGGPKNINTEYAYFMNFAIALCEGEVSRIGRIYAGGKEVDQEKYVIRKYLGTETQMPDELIVAKEGEANTPAFRGTCYVVFERLSVAEFGAQPQITAEVFRSVGALEPQIKAVAFNPDAGEFGFDTLEQSQNTDGEALPENRHVLTAATDFNASLEELKALAPNVSNATLHPQWFGDDLRCGKTQIKPAVRDKQNTLAWSSHTQSRATAGCVTHLFDLPLFGGTPDDAALARSALELKAQGVGVTLSPKLTMDLSPVSTWSRIDTPGYVTAYSPALRKIVGLGSAGNGGLSRDGEVWTTHSITPRNWTSVCWSAKLNLFVAVADDASGTTIASSTDGVVWVERSTIAGDWQVVIWSEGLGVFAATGNDAPHAIWSTDGISWTAGTAPARSWGLLTFSPKLSKFLALDTGSNKVMDSPDGKIWTERATNMYLYRYFRGRAAWSDELELFAAPARVSSTGLWTSPDGITWTYRAALGFSLITGVVAGGGGFLAWGKEGNISVFSDDAASWISVSTGVTYIGGLWLDDLARFVLRVSDGDTHLSNSVYKPSLDRLSCDPAWDQPGTPDAGGDVVALAAQIDAFFGTAVAADIAVTLADDAASASTIYSGANEWGYRRFILHYAQLAAQINAEQAGTITSFIIGDGMSGMTRLRASDSPELQLDYLTTEALVSLLTEVRSILGLSVEISYAANHDEYGALQLDAGRIGWPLDTLWGHTDCDFVGLNALFPLSDWRDGLSHLDALAGTATIYDQNYLQAGVMGGELYDWTYADQAARDAQTRTTIFDFVLSKEWVFRPKDLPGWWNNSHYARTAANTEHVSATPFNPQAKPIRFTSLMCNAVDKASNEPSARYDPASADHKRVWHSTGARDDAILRAALEAVLTYWNDAANNPTSGAYGGTMVDTNATTIGWYDARPHSTFPLDGRYWADADNHEYGPWVSGRLGVADAAGTIKKICEDFGFANYEVSNLGAVIDGITAQGGNSARSIFESLSPALLFDTIEAPNSIRFQRRGGAQITVSEAQLVQGEGDPWQITRAQETDLPVTVELSYGEVATDDQSSMVSATRGVAATDRIQTIGLPVVMPAARAKALADIALAEIWIGRESMELALPPSLLKVEAGDVLIVGAQRGSWRTTSITDGLIRTAQLTRFDSRIYTPVRYPRRAKYPVGTSPAGAVGSAQATPVPFFLDVPLLKDDHDPDAGYLAAYMKPMGNGVAAYRSPSETNFTLDQVLPLAAITGVTTANLPAGPLWMWDMASTLEVKLNDGQLEAMDDLSVLTGANAMALQQPSGEWEILQFADVEITGTRKYKLTRLLRGQRGSEHAMGVPLAAGARFVLLDAGVVQTGLTAASVGLERTWRIGPATSLAGDAVFGETTFTYTGKSRRPYAPVHLVAAANGADIDLTWVRRSRLGYGAWNQPSTPLAEDVEAYEIDIMDGGAVVRTLTVSTPVATYSEADQITDFGSAQTTLIFNVYQMSGQYGRGIAGSYSGAIT